MDRCDLGWITVMEDYRYDPVTGIFVRVATHGSNRAGTIRTPSVDGYVYLTARGRTKLGHRAAWEAAVSLIPEMIDHKNGCRSDNRLSNLRLASRSLNAANVHSRRALHKGVYLQKNGRYRAAITHNTKQIHLGCFLSHEEAVTAYRRAATKFFGEVLF